MSYLRAILSAFVAGLILYVTFWGANVIAALFVAMLPLGMLGDLGGWVGIFLVIMVVGFVGRFGVKYMP